MGYLRLKQRRILVLQQGRMLVWGVRDCILPQPGLVHLDSRVPVKGHGYLDLSADWPGCGS